MEIKFSEKYITVKESEFLELQKQLKELQKLAANNELVIRFYMDDYHTNFIYKAGDKFGIERDLEVLLLKMDNRAKKIKNDFDKLQEKDFELIKRESAIWESETYPRWVRFLFGKKKR